MDALLVGEPPHRAKYRGGDDSSHRRSMRRAPASSLCRCVTHMVETDEVLIVVVVLVLSLLCGLLHPYPRVVLVAGMYALASLFATSSNDKYSSRLSCQNTGTNQSTDHLGMHAPAVSSSSASRSSQNLQRRKTAGSPNRNRECNYCTTTQPHT
jgi:hypothetical protein